MATEIPMQQSILKTIRKLVGPEEDYTHFDMDLIIQINTAIGILNQLGVGPEDGFSIRDDTSKWSDLLEDETRYEMVKTYIYLFVKKTFDPPSNSFIVDSYEKTLKEIEWRLEVQADSDLKS